MRKGRVWLGMAAGIAMLAACGGAEVAPPTAASPTPTVAATPTAIASPTAIATPTASPVPTATATPAAVPTPTATPTASPLPAPVVMRYGAPQPTGIVDAPGEYAFFSNEGPVTTYEGLRQDVEQLVIHQRDADGASWAAFYAGVEAGDDFEWREADDCWVRYLVDEVLPDPTDAPLKVLAVRRYGYAYTGCSGAVPATGDRMWTWAPPNIQSPDITMPVRHGTFILSPIGWEGAIEEPGTIPASGCQVADPGTIPANAQEHPLWREPDLEDGWTLRYAETGIDGGDNWNAVYEDAHGNNALSVFAYQCYYYPRHVKGIQRPGDQSGYGGWINEIRLVDNVPAIVWYDPRGRGFSTRIEMIDERSGVAYIITGDAPGLRNNIEGLAEIARSLFADPAPVVMRYGAPEQGGIVDAPGEYAFFSADGPVTTYEGLRQDVEQLVIHQRDADGASWAAFYAGVEAGDDFEWREADDCWVRYLVDEVLPDPTDAPLKVLAVRRYGYAYTGCSGAVSTTGDRTLTWAPPDIGNTDITAPVRHGPWLLINIGFEGSVERQHQTSAPDSDQAVGGATDPKASECNPSNYREAQRCIRERSDRVTLPCQTASLQEARKCKGWREPSVPEGWIFSAAQQGVNVLGNPPNAYTYGYYTPEYPALLVTVFYLDWQPYYLGIVGRGETFPRAVTIQKMTLIDGRPAILNYNPTPGNRTRADVQIFDEETNIEYTLEGEAPYLRGTNIAGMIHLARSMFTETEALDESRITP